MPHKNIWHPFTIQKNMPEPLKVIKGDGIWLELEDGRRIIDAVSSWWVNLHGHSNPVIAEAIYEQAKKLEQVMFAGFTHEPAEELAELLAEKLPGSLNKVFFSDNGSTATEVAMKAALQYWQNKGDKRQTFICFEEAYHGDTFGAMSGSARSVWSDMFEDWMFAVEFVPYPETWIGDEKVGEREDAIIDHIEELLDQNPQKYAGIIIEPLIQGAGGMRMCRSEFLQKLHWVNRQFNTLLIFDEVMTGFGRTGDWFASKRAQVEPDIICLSKGISGGFLPISVTVFSEEIYDEFMTDEPLKTFWHGHSYTANPLGCAASVASIRLLEQNTMFREMEQIHLSKKEEVMKHPDIEKFRVTGTVAAFTIKTAGGDSYLSPVADRIKRECADKNVLIRPLGNTVYLMPPYVITPDELHYLWNQTLSLV
jgi:adenosylmethionine-8-amino-7-oxononanoate aminotransferase